MERGALDDLRDSIERDGLAQPPLVREHDGGYQIVAGHRRVACYRELAKENPEKYSTIPVNILSDCDDERALILLDVTNLIDGWRETRLWSAYAFAGLGLALSFNNDDAERANQRLDVDFQKLWRDNRWNPVVRGGLIADFWMNDNLAISVEANANMMPDHFNSKRGRGHNRDWHFNALVGVKFTLGPRHGRTEATYERRQPQVPPVIERKDSFIDVPIEKISFNVNIHFVINQSVIRSNQIPKLTRLLRYLDEHPRAFIRLSGYADKETGTPEINMRLSRERAQVVSQYLQDAGIQEWRIRRFAKGDRVQPFDIPEDNRVCICYVYDPDNPVRQDVW
jgi:outer membrane protein OmpA-like peptidoglycan-associated protein